MSTTKQRSYIEVDAADSSKTDDPIELFAYMLRKKHRATKEVEESNKKLLKSLILNNQIPKSSIVWHEEKVSRIYGFKVDNNGKIEYDTQSRSPQKRTVKAYVTDVPEVDISVLKDAIIRSKKMAI